MPLYTRFGDFGETMLYGGDTTHKSHDRIHAYGKVDELSSLLGLVRTEPIDARWREKIIVIQRALHAVGADLATPMGYTGKAVRMQPEQIREMEGWIDEAEALSAPLTSFILPGGCRAGSLLHHARTICRNAERWAFTLSKEDEVNEHCLTYLNRLSDYLFAMARVVNGEAGYEEEKI